MSEAFPLAWPPGKPRTPRHKIERSRFEPASRPSEIRAIQNEIRLLGGRDVIVSTNLRLKNDGLPYARDRSPEDAGVALYFTYKGGQKCFACDRWATIEENLRAIRKSVEAIRGLERWGSKDFVDAAFTGFDALPAPNAKRPWREVLGLSPDWSGNIEGVNDAFRHVARNVHPDRAGGSHEAMADLNSARDEAIQALSH